MKERARTTEEPNQAIVGRLVAEMTPEACSYLPPQDTVKRTLRRARAMEQRPMPLPSRLEDVVIPAQYASKIDGSRFLLHDSGVQDQDRFLIFCSPQMVDVLRTSKKWFADGTFKVAPELFYQVYSLHCEVGGSILPAAYILLTRKDCGTYTRALNTLNAECGGDCEPRTVTVDYELAAINAFRAVFPSADVRGCFFHLSQCVYRRLQSEGLQELYAFDPDINLEARMIPALAIVPQDDVEGAFTELASSIRAELLLVVDYFEDVFIGRLTARGRRDAQFPIKLWNHHDTVLQGGSKTTNSVEAWHRSFQAHVQCSHPTLWRFLEVLQREDALQLHRLGRLEMGQRFKQASKYAKAAERLKTLAREYDATDVRRFLRGVARNVSF
ncbi:uncharacterized protein LOC121837088 [Ixodes scapularis]|uniref:uncharacterized protein LOC121837088 n=1 Tax=Ixodes scapularis TaxID=6945 RepID=UPI001C38B076|nr:uncharacterized protein LOC121837088 [Ixodes scapularis]